MTSVVHRPLLTGRFQFGDPRLHTDADLALLAFAPDGALLSVEESGTLRRWDLESGHAAGRQVLSDLETRWSASPDGRILVSANDDVTLWDASSGLELISLPQESWVTALAVGPEELVVSGHDDGTIRLWDAATRHLLLARALEHHDCAISALALNRDGTQLAAASEDKTISLWHLASGALLGVLEGHSDRIPALAWHPRADLLVSAGWDTAARVWDTRRQSPLILLNSHQGQVTALAFNREGTRLATADSALTLHLWDFVSKKTLRQLRGPTAEIRTLAFSPDGSYLAANGERLIHVWDAVSGRALCADAACASTRTFVSVDPAGKRVVSNGGGHSVAVWDTDSRASVARLRSSCTVHEVRFSPDGTRIAGAAEDRLRLWDAHGKLLLECDGPQEPITRLAFSPDSALVATASTTGAPVWVWRVADGEPVLLIPDPLSGCAVEALAFHPDSNQLAVGGIDWFATGGSNGAISVWNLLGRFESILFSEGTTSLAFHPRGRLLASTSLDNSIIIWDLERRTLLTELPGHQGAVTCLAYSADGLWLASGGADQQLCLWDRRGALAGSVELDSQPTCVAFSPSGDRLYVGHANTTCSQISLASLGKPAGAPQ